MWMSALSKENLLAPSILVYSPKRQSQHHSIVQHLGILSELLRDLSKVFRASTSVLPCMNCLECFVTCRRLVVLSLQPLWGYYLDFTMWFLVITVPFWRWSIFSSRRLAFGLHRFRAIYWGVLFMPCRPLTIKASMGCPVLELTFIWCNYLAFIFTPILHRSRE